MTSGERTQLYAAGLGLRPTFTVDGDVVSTYTAAALPDPATSNQKLAILSDDRRGLWLNNNYGWGPVQFGSNIRYFGARCDDVTDDSVAVQLAINTASYLGGVVPITVPYSDKPCIANNLLLPSIGGVAAYQSITFQGEGPPPFVYGTLANSLTPPTVGSILKTTATSGSMISGSYGGAVDAVELTLRDLTLRGPDNSSVTIVNAALLYGVTLENLVVDTGRQTGSIVQPTNPSRGIVMPVTGNGGHNRIRNVAVGGYGIGLITAEHDDVDGIVLHGNAVGLKQGDSAFGQQIGRMLAFRNTVNIDYATSSSYSGGITLDIAQLNIEHADLGCDPTLPAWQVTTTDLRDTANLGRGKIRWQVVHACVGQVRPLPSRAANTSTHTRRGKCARLARPSSTPATRPPPPRPIRPVVFDTEACATCWDVGNFASLIAQPTHITITESGQYRIAGQVLGGSKRDGLALAARAGQWHVRSRDGETPGRLRRHDRHEDRDRSIP